MNVQNDFGELRRSSERGKPVQKIDTSPYSAASNVSGTSSGGSETNTRHQQQHHVQHETVVTPPVHGRRSLHVVPSFSLVDGFTSNNDDADVDVDAKEDDHTARDDAERETLKEAKTSSQAMNPMISTFVPGRPPWYSSLGECTNAFLIGICGGTASGKTTVAEMIIQALDLPWVVHLSMDSFYNPLTPAESALATKGEWNFDHPSKAFLSTIAQPRSGMDEL